MRTTAVVLIVLLTACSTAAHRQAYESAQRELEKAATQPPPAAQPPVVSDALLPPIIVEMPTVDGKPIEPRFDLEVNNAPASQVFMAIVSGTRYSMVVHPSTREPISLNLKDVTVFEALDTIRELYGYEYKVQGTRILIQPLGLQTRVFQVSYLLSQRKGRTEVRISSGAISDTTPGGAQGPVNAQVPGATGSRALESSNVTTTSNSDFWTEIAAAVRAMIGTEGGRNVVISPQGGVLVVRAFPSELRSVEEFLKTMSNVVERQVMLEAKIIEVQLADGYQTGINWSAFGGVSNRVAGGVLQPGTTLSPSGSLSAPTATNPDGSINASSTITATPGELTGSISTGIGTPGTLFGLAFQTGNFAALLSFLETQGKLQVLSSPRIATINNQKAVLKVGTDDFFVTNVTTNVTSSGTTTTQSPTITVQPFFSGVALDVTPQIDKDNFITLHIHPSVSSVIERVKTIDLGEDTGIFRLPLASSTISETDTIVRVADGNLVAIGGLMRETQVRDKGQVPGLGDVPVAGNLFRNQRSQSVKSELVILLKPTVIQGPAAWRQDILDTKERIDSIQRGDFLAPSQGGNQAPSGIR
jgi:MSHA biogenesis protein MshL